MRVGLELYHLYHLSHLVGVEIVEQRPDRAECGGLVQGFQHAPRSQAGAIERTGYSGPEYLSHFDSFREIGNMMGIMPTNNVPKLVTTGITGDPLKRMREVDSSCNQLFSPSDGGLNDHQRHNALQGLRAYIDAWIDREMTGLISGRARSAAG